MSVPLPVILDMDPGHDDAIALLLALASPELDVWAVTVVAGNQTLDKTLRNTLAVLTLAGALAVPVAAGAAAPLARPLRTAPQVHGESGLEGPELPRPVLEPDPRHAVDLMADVLRRAERPVTLIPTGPLTNVALFLLTHPRLVAEKVERIVLMGGAVAEGNVTPAAEFNIWVDPEAARVVFRAPVPVVMVGLDVTHRAIVTRAEAEALRARGGRVAAFVADLLDFFQRFHDRVYGFGGSPIHDACAVAEAIRPGLVRSRPMYVEVETAGSCAGRTVCDIRGMTGRPPNAHVGVDIAVAAFKQLLFGRLLRYDRGAAPLPRYRAGVPARRHTSVPPGGTSAAAVPDGDGTAPRRRARKGEGL